MNSSNALKSSLYISLLLLFCVRQPCSMIMSQIKKTGSYIAYYVYMWMNLVATIFVSASLLVFSKRIHNFHFSRPSQPLEPINFYLYIRLTIASVLIFPSFFFSSYLFWLHSTHIHIVAHHQLMISQYLKFINTFYSFLYLIVIPGLRFPAPGTKQHETISMQ